MSKKNEELDSLEIKLLEKLAKAEGKKNAISAPALAESLDVIPRKLRSTINHLIIDHHIPIGSSAGCGHHGYFMISTKKEADEFFHVFRSRGITGLLKASRIEKTTLLEMSLQLTLDFYGEEKKVPGTTEAVARLMKLFSKNPQLYSQEIKAMKSEVMPMLVDRAQMKEINDTARKLLDLTGGNS